MAANGLDLPEWLHKLFTEVNLEGITQAMTNVTLKDFTHLVDFVKGRELNADTITKLFEEANKLSGAGTAFAAACLVFSVIHICFPWALAAPFLNMIGFTVTNLAPASIVSAFQSIFGVNALFSLLQSAMMGGYGAPIVAGAIQGASTISAGLSAFKLWTMGNFTLPWSV
ncbi:hypothetical protein D6D15_08639 [Aureobasidium pullulans]|uniref:Uncharacterized protein n=1 Tax=Aureobasidium pullulans TaxID=5580 RepID=A0A4V4JGD4_AURPU|nr:hypothetical protein D6D15_08639 [Aureobasidium pullulans]THX70722.1 hypothetical protein D6D08_05687 [Aureobasidium pullulans]